MAGFAEIQGHYGIRICGLDCIPVRLHFVGVIGRIREECARLTGGL
jgi:hypothetical protein